VFVSDDAGKTWRQTLAADTDGNSPERAGGFVLVRDPNDADHILAAANGDGVFESHDNGKTWNNRGLEGIQPVHVLIDKTDSTRWWVCAKDYPNGQQQPERFTLRGGLFLTEDAGKTWTQLQTSDDTPSEFVQDPSDPGRLIGICRDYRLLCESLDDGVSWQPLSEGLLTDLETETLPKCSLYQYRALTAGPDFLLTVNTLGDIYRLQAGESQWKPVIPQMDVRNDIPWWGEKSAKFGLATASVTVSPQDPNTWYLTDFLSVFQTRDAGAHWTRNTEGIENTVVVGLAQDPTNPRVVHAALADIGYLRSDDSGESFHVMAAEGFRPNTALDRNCRTIAVSPENPARVYATTTQEGHWQIDQLYLSDDNGVSWRPSPMTGDRYPANTVAVNPADADEVIIGVSGKVAPGKGGVYRSDDGGENWEWIGNGLPLDRPTFGQVIFKPGPDLAMSADGSMVCFSADGRNLHYYDQPTARWEKASLTWDASTRPQCVVADVHHSGRFYLGIPRQGLYRSDDGGKSWSRLKVPDASGVAVDAAVPGRIAVSLDDAVLFSTDDGESWTALDEQLPLRDYRSTLAFAGDRLIVGTRGNGVFWITLPEVH
jgi:photosystem II stability/assembly factor-like uncharacterized protein